MAGPRNLVSPATFVDRNFGLMSVVQPRFDEPDAHWRNGVTFQDLCGLAGTTFDPYCVSGTGAPLKTPNVTVATYGALPFNVVAEVNCSPVGYSQPEQQSRAVDALTRNESFQVEQAFWTGAVAGVGSTIYQVSPHLAASTPVVDSLGVTLQCAATPVSGSVVLDIVEGIGRLEAAMSRCYNGQFVIHVPMILGNALLANYSAEVFGSQIKTREGNLVAIGAGYAGTGPDGTSIPNVAWVYATAPIFAYRSAPETFAFREELNRTNNTVQTIVERTYVLAFACCCFYAVPISVGGYTTGQPLSAF
jgi:hypothetical protein